MTTALVRELPGALRAVDDVEVVEHKGIGHPDTLCDGAAEAASRALGRAYLAKHGAVLHYNVDKALLVGGRAEARLGGGEVIAPFVLEMAGRAAGDVGDIVASAARAYLRETLHAVDVDRHVRVTTALHPGSVDLVDVFARSRRANDSSIGVGYAPLSPTERAVLAVARRLQTMARDPKTPEVGEDTKVLAVRRGRRVELTVACALIGGHLPSLARYLEARAAVATAVHAAAAESAGGALEFDVVVNAADDVERGSVYLTVTGTSAEAGDDGEVGRGNRVNGLITPMRPMSLEAAAGKNPITHVGKLYNVAADALARRLVAEVAAVTRAECFLVSRIGAAIDEPALVDVRIALREGESLVAQRARIEEIAREEVRAIPSVWKSWLSSSAARGP